MSRIDVAQLAAAIDAILISFPELADDEQLRHDVLDGETEISTIFSRILVQMRETSIMMAGIDKVMEDLNERGKRAARRHDAMRELIAKLMERAGLSKFTLPEATLSVSFRKGSPIVVDEAALPEECIRIERKPDKAVIKKWCESGNVPDGVALSNGKSCLTVRIK